MARSASRKMTRKSSKRSGSRKMMARKSSAARKACVKRTAKQMHKKARTTRGHQLALGRAQKACSK